MTTFFLATLVASLIGSLHCAGMCGPFVLMAVGTENRVRRLASYHLGRLVMYVSLGAVAGAAGSALDLSGRAMGFQQTAAIAAGIVMIAWGVILLLRVFGFSRLHVTPPTIVVEVVQSGFRRVKYWPRTIHALAIGTLSGLLPCGWLYLFVLAATGTGAATSGASMLFAFWLGTLPVLTALATGVSRLSNRFRPMLPFAAAVICLAAGSHTLLVRARADLTTIQAPALDDAAMREANLGTFTEQPLPCCRHAH